jgi:hypothetical protein
LPPCAPDRSCEVRVAKDEKRQARELN